MRYTYIIIEEYLNKTYERKSKYWIVSGDGSEPGDKCITTVSDGINFEVVLYELTSKYSLPVPIKKWEPSEFLIEIRDQKLNQILG